MCWLDAVADHGDDWLEAEATVRPTGVLGNDAGVGAWAGVEYMAQAIAALAGLTAQAHGEPVKIGFLVGSRRYVSRWSWLPVGSRLRIRVALAYTGGNGLSVFDCGMRCGAEEVAQAALMVFQPADAAAFLRQEQP
jgi:predicted hotdog family 3-hydroxylacyl-ACP dehydratase